VGDFQEGENEACKQEADIGILENRVEHFDPMIVGSSRAFVRIKNEMKKDALDYTEQDKSGCERKFDQVDGKRTRANQEKIGLRV